MRGGGAGGGTAGRSTPAPVTPRFSPLRRGARGAAAARQSARPRGRAGGNGARRRTPVRRDGSGRGGAGAGEKEAAAVPHHVQHLPAGGAGTRLPQVPLPRRVHQVAAAGGRGRAGGGPGRGGGGSAAANGVCPQRGAGGAPGPDGSPRAGECGRAGRPGTLRPSICPPSAEFQNHPTARAESSC